MTSAGMSPLKRMAKCRRWLAILVLFTDFGSIAAGAAPPPSPVPSQTASANADLSFARTQFRKWGLDSFAKIERTNWDGASKKPVLFLLQDAHANFSCQANTAQVLKVLREKHGVEWVFVEGGEGDLSLSELKARSTAESRREVGMRLMRQGLMQGGEYASLTSEFAIRLWGVEGTKAYRQAKKLYFANQAKRARTEKWFAELESRSDELARGEMSPALRDLWAARRVYGRGELTLDRYLEEIAGLAGRNGIETGETIRSFLRLRSSAQGPEDAREEWSAFALEEGAAAAWIHEGAASEAHHGGFGVPAEIDRLAFFNRVRSEFFDGRRDGADLSRKYPALARYLRVVEAAVDLDPEKLESEIQNLEGRLLAALGGGRSAEEWFEWDDTFARIRSTALLRASSKDAGSRPGAAAAQIARLAGFVNRRAALAGEDWAIAPDGAARACARTATRFYGLTLRRDHRMIARSLAKMRSEGVDRAVLIAGGYHERGLIRLLEQKGQSYLSVRPFVFHETDRRRYEKVLRGKNSTLMPRQIRTGEGPIAYEELAALVSAAPANAPGARLSAKKGGEGGQSGIRRAGRRLKNMTMAVNLLDIGLTIQGRKIGYADNLNRLIRFLPEIASVGLSGVYVYNGLFVMSRLSQWVHTANSARRLRFYQRDGLTVVSGSYDTRLERIGPYHLTDRFGSNFSPESMEKLNPWIAAADLDPWNEWKRANREAFDRGIEVTADFVSWLSPDAIGADNYRQTFYREVPEAFTIQWRALPEDSAPDLRLDLKDRSPEVGDGMARDARAVAAGQMTPDAFAAKWPDYFYATRKAWERELARSDMRWFARRVVEGGSERLILVRHFAFFGIDSRDQVILNPLVPAVRRYFADAMKRQVDAGVGTLRVDLGHLMLKRHIRGYFQDLESVGVDLKAWMSANGAAIPARQSFWQWFDAQEEPWREVLAEARFHAVQNYDRDIRFVIEAYAPADQHEMFLLGAESAYSGDLFHAYHAIARAGAPARSLHEGINRALGDRPRSFVYLSNFDQVSLKLMGGPVRAGAMLMVILSHLGVRTMVDWRDWTLRRGHPFKIVGGDPNPGSPHTHAWPTEEELVGMTNLEEWIRLTRESEWAKAAAQFFEQVPDENETYIRILNNSNLDRFFSIGWKAASGHWTVAVLDFKPQEGPAPVRVELPGEGEAGFVIERHRATVAGSGRVLEPGSWEGGGPSSGRTVEILPSELASGAAFVRLTRQKGPSMPVAARSVRRTVAQILADAGRMFWKPFPNQRIESIRTILAVDYFARIREEALLFELMDENYFVRAFAADLMAGRFAGIRPKIRPAKWIEHLADPELSNRIIGGVPYMPWGVTYDPAKARRNKRYALLWAMARLFEERPADRAQAAYRTRALNAVRADLAADAASWNPARQARLEAQIGLTGAEMALGADTRLTLLEVMVLFGMRGERRGDAPDKFHWVGKQIDAILRHADVSAASAIASAPGARLASEERELVIRNSRGLHTNPSQVTGLVARRIQKVTGVRIGLEDPLDSSKKRADMTASVEIMSLGLKGGDSARVILDGDERSRDYFDRIFGILQRLWSDSKALERPSVVGGLLDLKKQGEYISEVDGWLRPAEAGSRLSGSGPAASLVFWLGPISSASQRQVRVWFVAPKERINERAIRSREFEQFKKRFKSEYSKVLSSERIRVSVEYHYGTRALDRIRSSQNQADILVIGRVGSNAGFKERIAGLQTAGSSADSRVEGGLSRVSRRIIQSLATPRENPFDGFVAELLVNPKIERTAALEAYERGWNRMLQGGHLTASQAGAFLQRALLGIRFDWKVVEQLYPESAASGMLESYRILLDDPRPGFRHRLIREVRTNLNGLSVWAADDPARTEVRSDSIVFVSQGRVLKEGFDSLLAAVSSGLKGSGARPVPSRLASIRRSGIDAALYEEAVRAGKGFQSQFGDTLNSDLLVYQQKRNVAGAFAYGDFYFEDFGTEQFVLGHRRHPGYVFKYVRNATDPIRRRGYADKVLKFFILGDIAERTEVREDRGVPVKLWDHPLVAPTAVTPDFDLQARVEAGGEAMSRITERFTRSDIEVVDTNAVNAGMIGGRARLTDLGAFEISPENILSAMDSHSDWRENEDIPAYDRLVASARDLGRFLPELSDGLRAQHITVMAEVAMDLFLTQEEPAAAYRMALATVRHYFGPAKGSRLAFRELEKLLLTGEIQVDPDRAAGLAAQLRENGRRDADFYGNLKSGIQGYETVMVMEPSRRMAGLEALLDRFGRGGQTLSAGMAIALYQGFRSAGWEGLKRAKAFYETDLTQLGLSDLPDVRMAQVRVLNLLALNDAGSEGQRYLRDALKLAGETRWRIDRGKELDPDLRGILLAEAHISLGTVFKNRYRFAADLYHLRVLRDRWREAGYPTVEAYEADVDRLARRFRPPRRKGGTRFLSSPAFLKHLRAQMNKWAKASYRHYRLAFETDGSQYAAFNAMMGFVYSGQEERARMMVPLFQRTVRSADFFNNFHGLGSYLVSEFIGRSPHYDYRALQSLGLFLSAVKGNETEIASFEDHLRYLLQRRLSQTVPLSREDERWVSLIRQTIDTLHSARVSPGSVSAGPAGDYGITGVEKPVRDARFVENEKFFRALTRETYTIAGRPGMNRFQNSYDTRGRLSVPGVIVNHLDEAFAQKILTRAFVRSEERRVSLMDLDSIDEVHRELYRISNRLFRLDQGMEQSESEHHRLFYDEPIERIKQVFGADLSGRGALNVAVAYYLGLGDCRLEGQSTAYFLQKWLYRKWDREHQKIFRVITNEKMDDTTRRREYDQAISAMYRNPLASQAFYLVDTAVSLPVQKDDSGSPRRRPDGYFVASRPVQEGVDGVQAAFAELDRDEAEGKLLKSENHTTLLLVRYDGLDFSDRFGIFDPYIQSGIRVAFRDFFYQNFYRLGDTGYFDRSDIRVTGSQDAPSLRFIVPEATDVYDESTGRIVPVYAVLQPNRSKREGNQLSTEPQSTPYLYGVSPSFPIAEAVRAIADYVEPARRPLTGLGLVQDRFRQTLADLAGRQGARLAARASGETDRINEAAIGALRDYLTRIGLGGAEAIGTEQEFPVYVVSLGSTGRGTSIFEPGQQGFDVDLAVDFDSGDPARKEFFDRWLGTARQGPGSTLAERLPQDPAFRLDQLNAAFAERGIRLGRIIKAKVTRGDILVLEYEAGLGEDPAAKKIKIDINFSSRRDRVRGMYPHRFFYQMKQVRSLGGSPKAVKEDIRKLKRFFARSGRYGKFSGALYEQLVILSADGLAQKISDDGWEISSVGSYESALRWIRRMGWDDQSGQFIPLSQARSVFLIPFGSAYGADFLKMLGEGGQAEEDWLQIVSGVRAELRALEDADVGRSLAAVEKAIHRQSGKRVGMPEADEPALTDALIARVSGIGKALLVDETLTREFVARQIPLMDRALARLRLSEDSRRSAWAYTLPGGEDWMLYHTAYFISSGDDYVRRLRRLAGLSGPRTALTRLALFGPHLRYDFNWDVDESDIKGMLHVGIPVFKEWQKMLREEEEAPDSAKQEEIDRWAAGLVNGFAFRGPIGDANLTRFQETVLGQINGEAFGSAGGRRYPSETRELLRKAVIRYGSSGAFTRDERGELRALDSLIGWAPEIYSSDIIHKLAGINQALRPEDRVGLYEVMTGDPGGLSRRIRSDSVFSQSTDLEAMSRAAIRSLGDLTDMLLIDPDSEIIPAGGARLAGAFPASDDARPVEALVAEASRQKVERLFGPFKDAVPSLAYLLDALGSYGDGGAAVVSYGSDSDRGYLPLRLSVDGQKFFWDFIQTDLAAYQNNRTVLERANLAGHQTVDLDAYILIRAQKSGERTYHMPYGIVFGYAGVPAFLDISELFVGMRAPADRIQAAHRTYHKWALEFMSSNGLLRRELLASGGDGTFGRILLRKWLARFDRERRVSVETGSMGRQIYNSYWWSYSDPQSDSLKADGAHPMGMHLFDLVRIHSGQSEREVDYVMSPGDAHSIDWQEQLVRLGAVGPSGGWRVPAGEWSDRSVTILGSGTGVDALLLARMGARSVIATEKYTPTRTLTDLNMLYARATDQIPPGFRFVSFRTDRVPQAAFGTSRLLFNTLGVRKNDDRPEFMGKESMTFSLRQLEGLFEGVRDYLAASGERDRAAILRLDIYDDRMIERISRIPSQILATQEVVGNRVREARDFLARYPDLGFTALNPQIGTFYRITAHKDGSRLALDDFAKDRPAPERVNRVRREAGVLADVLALRLEMIGEAVQDGHWDEVAEEVGAVESRSSSGYLDPIVRNTINGGADLAFYDLPSSLSAIRAAADTHDTAVIRVHLDKLGILADALRRLSAADSPFELFYHPESGEGSRLLVYLPMSADDWERLGKIVGTPAGRPAEILRKFVDAMQLSDQVEAGHFVPSANPSDWSARPDGVVRPSKEFKLTEARQWADEMSRLIEAKAAEIEGRWNSGDYAGIVRVAAEVARKADERGAGDPLRETISLGYPLAFYDIKNTVTGISAAADSEDPERFTVGPMLTRMRLIALFLKRFSLQRKPALFRIGDKNQDYVYLPMRRSEFRESIALAVGDQDAVRLRRLVEILSETVLGIGTDPRIRFWRGRGARLAQAGENQKEDGIGGLILRDGITRADMLKHFNPRMAQAGSFALMMNLLGRFENEIRPEYTELNYALTPFYLTTRGREFVKDAAGMLWARQLVLANQAHQTRETFESRRLALGMPQAPSDWKADEGRAFFDPYTEYVLGQIEVSDKWELITVAGVPHGLLGRIGDAPAYIDLLDLVRASSADPVALRRAQFDMRGVADYFARKIWNKDLAHLFELNRIVRDGSRWVRAEEAPAAAGDIPNHPTLMTFDYLIDSAVKESIGMSPDDVFSRDFQAYTEKILGADPGAFSGLVVGEIGSGVGVMPHLLLRAGAAEVRVTEVSAVPFVMTAVNTAFAAETGQFKLADAARIEEDGDRVVIGGRVTVERRSGLPSNLSDMKHLFFNAPGIEGNRVVEQAPSLLRRNPFFVSRNIGRDDFVALFDGMADFVRSRAGDAAVHVRINASQGSGLTAQTALLEDWLSALRAINFLNQRQYADLAYKQIPVIDEDEGIVSAFYRIQAGRIEGSRLSWSREFKRAGIGLSLFAVVAAGALGWLIHRMRTSPALPPQNALRRQIDDARQEEKFALRVSNWESRLQKLGVKVDLPKDDFVGAWLKRMSLKSELARLTVVQSGVSPERIESASFVTHPRSYVYVKLKDGSVFYFDMDEVRFKTEVAVERAAVAAGLDPAKLDARVIFDPAGEPDSIRVFVREGIEAVPGLPANFDFDSYAPRGGAARPAPDPGGRLADQPSQAIEKTGGESDELFWSQLGAKDRELKEMIVSGGLADMEQIHALQRREPGKVFIKDLEYLDTNDGRTVYLKLDAPVEGVSWIRFKGVRPRFDSDGRLIPYKNGSGYVRRPFGINSRGYLSTVSMPDDWIGTLKSRDAEWEYQMMRDLPKFGLPVDRALEWRSLRNPSDPGQEYGWVAAGMSDRDYRIGGSEKTGDLIAIAYSGRIGGEKRRILNRRQIESVFVQTGANLRKLHQAGFVHRYPTFGNTGIQPDPDGENWRAVMRDLNTLRRIPKEEGPEREARERFLDFQKVLTNILLDMEHSDAKYAMLWAFLRGYFADAEEAGVHAVNNSLINGSALSRSLFQLLVYDYEFKEERIAGFELTAEDILVVQSAGGQQSAPNPFKFLMRELTAAAQRDAATIPRGELLEADEAPESDPFADQGGADSWRGVGDEDRLFDGFQIFKWTKYHADLGMTTVLVSIKDMETGELIARASDQDVWVNVYHAQNLIKVTSFYPNFPYRSKARYLEGRGRGLLRLLLKEYGGYEVFANASEEFQRSFKELHDFNPLARVDGHAQLNRVVDARREQVARDVDSGAISPAIGKRLDSVLTGVTLYGIVPNSMEGMAIIGSRLPNKASWYGWILGSKWRIALAVLFPAGAFVAWRVATREADLTVKEADVVVDPNPQTRPTRKASGREEFERLFVGAGERITRSEYPEDSVVEAYLNALKDPKKVTVRDGSFPFAVAKHEDRENGEAILDLNPEYYDDLYAKVAADSTPNLRALIMDATVAREAAGLRFMGAHKGHWLDINKRAAALYAGFGTDDERNKALLNQNRSELSQLMAALMAPELIESIAEMKLLKHYEGKNLFDPSVAQVEMRSAPPLVQENARVKLARYKVYPDSKEMFRRQILNYAVEWSKPDAPVTVNHRIWKAFVSAQSLRSAETAGREGFSAEAGGYLMQGFFVADGRTLIPSPQMIPLLDGPSRERLARAAALTDSELRRLADELYEVIRASKLLPAESDGSRLAVDATQALPNEVILDGENNIQAAQEINRRIDRGETVILRAGARRYEAFEIIDANSRVYKVRVLGGGPSVENGPVRVIKLFVKPEMASDPVVRYSVVKRLARIASAAPPDLRKVFLDPVAYPQNRLIEMDYAQDKRLDRVSYPRWSAAIQSLATVVVYLHERGVYHGDLRPENVLIAEDGSIRLFDFEDFGGPMPSPTDERGLIDVQGIGDMLYEMATGRRVLDDQRYINAIRSRGRGGIEWDENDRFSQELKETIRRAIFAGRGDGYRSARELRDALVRALPIGGDPDSQQEPASRLAEGDLEWSEIPRTDPEARSEWLSQLDRLDTEFDPQRRVGQRRLHEHLRESRRQMTAAVEAFLIRNFFDLSLPEGSGIYQAVLDPQKNDAIRFVAESVKRPDERRQIQAAVESIGVNLTASLRRARQSASNYSVANTHSYWRDDKLSAENRVALAILMIGESDEPKDAFDFVRGLSDLDPSRVDSLIGELETMRSWQARISRWSLMRRYPYITALNLYHGSRDGAVTSPLAAEFKDPTYFTGSRQVAEEYAAGSAIQLAIPLGSIAFVGNENLGEGAEYIVDPGVYESAPAHITRLQGTSPDRQSPQPSRLAEQKRTKERRDKIQAKLQEPPPQGDRWTTTLLAQELGLARTVVYDDLRARSLLGSDRLQVEEQGHLSPEEITQRRDRIESKLNEDPPQGELWTIPLLAEELGFARAVAYKDLKARGLLDSGRLQVEEKIRPSPEEITQRRDRIESKLNENPPQGELWTIPLLAQELGLGRTTVYDDLKSRSLLDSDRLQVEEKIRPSPEEITQRRDRIESKFNEDPPQGRFWTIPLLAQGLDLARTTIYNDLKARGLLDSDRLQVEEKNRPSQKELTQRRSLVESKLNEEPPQGDVWTITLLAQELDLAWTTIYKDLKARGLLTSTQLSLEGRNIRPTTDSRPTAHRSAATWEEGMDVTGLPEDNAALLELIEERLTPEEAQFLILDFASDEPIEATAQRFGLSLEALIAKRETLLTKLRRPGARLADERGGRRKAEGEREKQKFAAEQALGVLERIKQRGELSESLVHSLRHFAYSVFVAVNTGGWNKKIAPLSNLGEELGIRRKKEKEVVRQGMRAIATLATSDPDLARVYSNKIYNYLESGSWLTTHAVSADALWRNPRQGVLSELSSTNEAKMLRAWLIRLSGKPKYQPLDAPRIPYLTGGGELLWFGPLVPKGRGAISAGIHGVGFAGGIRVHAGAKIAKQVRRQPASDFLMESRQRASKIRDLAAPPALSALPASEVFVHAKGFGGMDPELRLAMLEGLLASIPAQAPIHLLADESDELVARAAIRAAGVEARADFAGQKLRSDASAVHLFVMGDYLERGESIVAADPLARAVVLESPAKPDEIGLYDFRSLGGYIEALGGVKDLQALGEEDFKRAKAVFSILTGLAPTDAEFSAVTLGQVWAVQRFRITPQALIRGLQEALRIYAVSTDMARQSA